MLPLLPFQAKQDRPLAIDARLIGMACLVALGSISQGFALESFEVRAGAFIRDHCLECHSSQMPKGELDLEIMLTPGQFQRYYPEWSSVLDRVAQGEMPPAEADQPSPQEKLELTELIAETIRNESAQGSGDPGAVIMRRLTRGEYHHVIKDLTGLTLDFWDLLPGDAVGGEGFASHGQVQFVQSSDLERYLDAAKAIAARMVIGAGPLFFYQDPGMLGQEWSAITRINEIYRHHGFRNGAGEGAEPYGLDLWPRVFYLCWRLANQTHEDEEAESEAIVSLSRRLEISPAFAEHIYYQLQRADAFEPLQAISQAFKELPAHDPLSAPSFESSSALMDPVVAQVRQWQQKLARAKADREETDLLDAVALMGQASPSPAAMQFALAFPTVSHREPAPSDRDPIPRPFTSQYNHPERNAFHYQVKYHRQDDYLVRYLLGPKEREQLDQAWDDLLSAFDYHQANLNLLYEHFQPIAEDGIPRIEELDAQSIDLLEDDLRGWVRALHAHWREVGEAHRLAYPGHLDQCLEMARLAWRHDLTEGDRQQLLEFYRTRREMDQLSHREALQSLLVRILVSPKFLYRLEPPQKSPLESREVIALTGESLATRLSFMLWGSMPDLALLNDGRNQNIVESEHLLSHFNRMRIDPRMRRFASEFFGQWFGFYRFVEFRGVDASRFPNWEDALRQDLQIEATLFFEDLVMRDGRVSEILFSDAGFINQRLAQHYGLPEAAELEGAGFVKISSLGEHGRGGLLALGAIHALTSAPARTSVVKRGDWILRRVLGTPVPPPPDDAGSLQESRREGEATSIKDLLASHQRDASCVSCHARMDPLGFAMEGFGVLGQPRLVYEEGLPVEQTGTMADGRLIDGYQGLRDYMSDHIELFYRTFCRKLIGYSLGRAEQLTDHALVEALMQSLRAGDPLSAQLKLMILSPQFQNQRTQESK